MVMLVHLELAFVLVGWTLFAGFLLFRLRSRGLTARRDRRSLIGMGLQGTGLAIVWGIRRAPIPGTWEPVRALIVGMCLVISLALALSAVRRLGKQWSLAARVLDNHELITSGPYALVRHPIYAGVLGMLLATGLAVSHWWALGIGALVYLLGTVLRIRVEERLLHTSFGRRYEDYARRVPAVIPRWHPRRSTGLGAIVLVTAVTTISGCSKGPVDSASRFDCVQTFPPDLNRDALIQAFGAAHVVSADIPLGEGESEPGTVLFPDQPDRKVEILWKFPKEARSPRSVKISGRKSQWSAAEGLTLGLTLDEVERRNGRPFEIMGFGWDRGGAVPSWSGGALDASQSCRLRARFEPDSTSQNDPRLREVQGDRAFASNDSLVRSLPLRVTEIWLAY